MSWAVVFPGTGWALVCMCEALGWRVILVFWEVEAWVVGLTVKAPGL